MKKSILRIVRGVLIFLMGREKLVFLLTNNREKRLLGFETDGYLYDVGWLESMNSNSVIDAAGKPIPWLTYPVISFLEARLNKSLEIFEFGSGNSTLYFAGKVGTVDSVEHDKFWYDKVKNTMPQNSTLYFCEMEYGGAYCQYVQKTSKPYDIIVVDGRDRVSCCKNSIASLKPGGVVLLDDSEREKYADGVAFMTDQGFKKIDFWGLAPMVKYLKCTTVFYRDNNCLGI
jgi:hypothetical protein